jgi:hypothetical protein
LKNMIVRIPMIISLGPYKRLLNVYRDLERIMDDWHINNLLNTDSKRRSLENPIMGIMPKLWEL